MNNSVSLSGKLNLNSFAHLLTLIGIFIIYFSPFWWPSSNTNAVALVRAFIFISAFVFIFEIIFFKIKNGFKLNLNLNLSNILILSLFFYMIINTYFLSADTQPIRRVLFLIMFGISISFLNIRPGLTRGFFVLLAFSGFCFAAYSLVSLYMLDLLPTAYRSSGLSQSANENIANFGSTIFAAMHFAITFILLVYLFLTETKRILLFLWLLFLTVVSVYIAFTFSRTGWVACTVAFMSIYIFTFDKRKIRFYLLLIMLLSLLVYFSINFLQYEFNERGLTSRDQIWEVVLSRMSEHWVFGYGLSTALEPISINEGRQIVGNTHNVYLEILYQTGFVGLILFLLVVIRTLYVLYKAIRNPLYGDVMILFFSGLLAVLVVMFIELNSWVSTPNLLWQWLWMPIALSLNISREMEKID